MYKGFDTPAIEVNEKLLPFSITPKLIELLTLLATIQSSQKATVFFEIYGHVNKLEIKIYEPFWYAGMNYTYEEGLYLDEDQDENIQYAIDYLTSHFLNS